MTNKVENPTQKEAEKQIEFKTPRPISFPEQVQSILLILDLDGTLICDDSDLIKLRPYLQNFFEEVSKMNYTLALWTAGSTERVRRFCSQINQKFLFTWNGERCSRKADTYAGYDRYHSTSIKNLSPKFGRDLRKRDLIEQIRSLLMTRLVHGPSTMGTRYPFLPICHK